MIEMARFDIIVTQPIEDRLATLGQLGLAALQNNAVLLWDREARRRQYQERLKSSPDRSGHYESHGISSITGVVDIRRRAQPVGRYGSTMHSPSSSLTFV